MFKRIYSFLFFIVITVMAHSQLADSIIVAAEVERIEKTLSADDMQGRKPFTTGIDKAADFIAAEFQKAGIRPREKNSFFQSFNVARIKFLSAKGNLNGRELDQKNIVIRSTEPVLSVTNASGYEIINIGAKDTPGIVLQRLLSGNKNYLVTIDTVHSLPFNRMKRQVREVFPQTGNLILLLTNENAKTFSIEASQEITMLTLKNVVGIIPGKSKKEEYVIFSGHYDHLGIARPNKDNDSIYNGANDDASGVTAVIMLAKYFSRLNSNERTLVFTAFTAEETGGYGSQYFSRQFPPEKVVAMFNIEMIGTESKWGTHSAFITGYEKTDMGKILEKNLEGSVFHFYPDPYPQQQLFYRSDNATLARLGVPAHTISTAKMDTEKPEPFYHSFDDEIETLDMKNMAEIIKSIAISSVSIVAGKDTPSRVVVSQLR
ncbi:MAG TPA: M28 family peptidase [Flavitalea sp.]|nr:M28 family peptidase [Flavitalea sp.]